MSKIGHNSRQAIEPGFGWRRHCWKRARSNLLKNKVPVEIVRLRVRRSKELGLTYPQYANVLLGSGRDIVGFLFTVDGLQLRLRRKLEIEGKIRERLQNIKSAKLTAFAPSGENPSAFKAELSHLIGAEIAGVGRCPEPTHLPEWPSAVQAVREALDPARLPGGAVLLVGRSESERIIATAGRMAGFMVSGAYFDNGA